MKFETKPLARMYAILLCMFLVRILCAAIDWQTFYYLPIHLNVLFISGAVWDVLFFLVLLLIFYKVKKAQVGQRLFYGLIPLFALYVFYFVKKGAFFFLFDEKASAINIVAFVLAILFSAGLGFLYKYISSRGEAFLVEEKKRALFTNAFLMLFTFAIIVNVALRLAGGITFDKGVAWHLYHRNKKVSDVERKRVLMSNKNRMIELRDPLYNTGHYRFSEENIFLRKKRKLPKRYNLKTNNVVFVVLESLQSWPLGNKQKDVVVGKEFFETKDLIEFKNIYSLTDQDQASYEALFYSGTAAQKIGGDNLNRSRKGLFSYLAAAGFSTTVISSHKDDIYSGKDMIREHLAPNRHFTYNDILKDDSKAVVERFGTTDESLYDFAYKKIVENKKGKNFTTIFTSSTFYPFEAYNSVKERDRVFDEVETTRHVAKAQINKFSYALNELGDFVKKVRETSGLENTLFIVVSNHVPTKVWESGKIAMSERLWLNLQKIPFYIISPELKDLKEFTYHPGTQLDITPTIIDLLGIEEDQTVFLGQSIVRVIHPKRFIPAINAKIMSGTALFEGVLYNIGREGRILSPESNDSVKEDLEDLSVLMNGVYPDLTPTY